VIAIKSTIHFIAFASVKPLKEDGTSSVVIDDDDLEGEDAVIVLLNKDGQIVAQEFTVIGGGNE